MTEPRPADRLNRDCHCISVDRASLDEALRRDLPQSEALSTLLEATPGSFATSPVFLDRGHFETMQRAIDALGHVVALPGYRELVARRGPELAAVDSGPRGVFFGFDFHLAEDGPKLIEINTNAGGALLNLYLARAQRACCSAVEPLTTGGPVSLDLELAWMSMFRRELELLEVSRDASRELQRVAIVDEDPTGQFLFPEMELFRSLFARHGVAAVVADPNELVFEGNRLLHAGLPVDLVYNRMTDFYLEGSAARPLAAALREGAVAVTPNPHAYSLWADKRNLVVLSDRGALERLGAAPEDVALLQEVVPATLAVSRENAETLWGERKSWFFKPGAGFGSRGAYDGAKLTRKTFDRLVDESYVAQRKIPPSLRRLILEGEERDLKVDLRCIVYDGAIQMVSARLYRGQVTNLRTAGGGLATVFTTPGVTETAAQSSE